MSEPIEILLIEDSANDVELTLRALKKHNVSNNVHVASDGAEALRYLFPEPPGEPPPAARLIILDLKLPKVDGLEVLKRIKADHRTRVTPVVVMTSSQEERDLVESYQLGTNSYVVKPLDFDKFADAVAQIGLYWLLLNNMPESS
jgi:two-component system response regulator